METTTITEATTFDRSDWDAAVAVTRFKKGDNGWHAVGPLATAGQAMDGKEAFIDVRKKSGEIKTGLLIRNSRRFYTDDDGVQFFIADIV